MKNLIIILMLFTLGCEQASVERQAQTKFEIESYFVDDVNEFYDEADYYGFKNLPKDNLIVQRLPQQLNEQFNSRSFKEGDQWFIEVNYMIVNKCWRGVLFRELARVLLEKENDCFVPPGYSPMQNMMCDTYEPSCSLENPAISLIWRHQLNYLFTGKP